MKPFPASSGGFMIFDLVVIAALIVSCLIAFFRGFIREALTIIGVVGGLFAAVTLGPSFSPVVHGWLGEPGKTEDGKEEKLFGVLPYDMAADLIAYGSIFIIVVIILSVISHLMAGAARKLGLGP